MKEIHYTKKDFRVEWFSGTGAGGQYRNKHQNCCRITHIPSGIISISTERERTHNLRFAFHALAKKVIAWAQAQDQPISMINKTVIRNYNESRNEVHDKESGLKMPYVDIVTKNNIAPMIEARKAALC